MVAMLYERLDQVRLWKYRTRTETGNRDWFSDWPHLYENNRYFWHGFVIGSDEMTPAKNLRNIHQVCKGIHCEQIIDDFIKGCPAKKRFLTATLMRFWTRILVCGTVCIFYIPSYSFCLDIINSWWCYLKGKLMFFNNPLIHSTISSYIWVLKFLVWFNRRISY